MQIEKINIDLIDIDKEQPRKKFENIGELASAILKEGLLEPLKIIKKEDGRYLLIDGERRLKAITLLHKKDNTFPSTIKCIVIDSPENKLITQLILDIHKQKLEPFEEANAFKKLIEEQKFSIDNIKIRTGKSRNYIVHRLKILAFNERTIEKIKEGKIPITSLANIEIEKFKEKEDIIIDRIIKEGANSERIKEIIKEEVYRYEFIINNYFSHLDKFLDRTKQFQEDILKEIKHKSFLINKEETLQNTIKDVQKFIYNLEKFDKIKKKQEILEDKLKDFLKTYPKEKKIGEIEELKNG